MIIRILIKLFFLIPASFFKLLFIFTKNIKRGYIFDPQSRALLYLLPNLNLQELGDEAVPDIRNLIIKNRKKMRLSLKTKRRVETVDHFLDDENKILLREYIPYKIDNSNIILYFHGGGYVLNSIETHNESVSYISEKLRTRVFSLNYSKSPEVKFPFAMNEGLQALEWLNDQNYPIQSISLCGDSAGAHLAASISHYLESNNKQNVHSQFLIYPMCDPKCNSLSYEEFKNGYLLTKENMQWFWDKFSDQTIETQTNPSFNLMLLEEKIKLPKTFIVTAGFDPLLDESEKYAFLLYENDTYVKQLHYPTLFHGFASMNRLKMARIAVDDFLNEYKKIL